MIYAYGTYNVAHLTASIVTFLFPLLPRSSLIPQLKTFVVTFQRHDTDDLSCVRLSLFAQKHGYVRRVRIDDRTFSKIARCQDVL